MTSSARQGDLRTAVVLDPEPLWSEAVAGVLARLGISVASAARTGRSALAAVARSKPDLLVMEVALGPDDIDPLTCLAEVQRLKEGIRCVVLSDVAALETRLAAFRAGAGAYVLKTAEPEELVSAVRQVFRRSIFFPPTLEVSVDRPQPVPSPGHAVLTRRELEILSMVAAGGQSSEIAAYLWVTEQTVKFHLSNIYRKLGVSNRTQASRWAFEHGVLPTRPGDRPVAGDLAKAPPMFDTEQVVGEGPELGEDSLGVESPRAARVNLRTRAGRTPGKT